VHNLVNTSGSVVSCYLYSPWGQLLGQESNWSISAFYNFAGYWTDGELDQFHCSARQYDVILGRFTTRDPVKGTLREPMTLHKYLYCLNNPLNATDPNGEFLGLIGGQGISARMRASMASIGTGILGQVQRLVNAINFRNVMTDVYLRSSSSLSSAISGITRLWSSFATRWPSASGGDQLIGGVRFWSHALSRMGPEAFGGRGVPPSAVFNAMTYGEQIIQENGRIMFVYENVRVVFDPIAQAVVTVIKTGH